MSICMAIFKWLHHWGEHSFVSVLSPNVLSHTTY